MKKNLKMMAVLSAAAVMTVAAPEMGFTGGSSTAYAKTIGWVEENGKKYYLANAQLMTGWRKIDNKQYYFNEDGTMATGWITIDGKSYFLKEDGSLDATAKK